MALEKLWRGNPRAGRKNPEQSNLTSEISRKRRAFDKGTCKRTLSEKYNPKEDSPGRGSVKSRAKRGRSKEGNKRKESGKGRRIILSPQGTERKGLVIHQRHC